MHYYLFMCLYIGAKLIIQFNITRTHTSESNCHVYCLSNGFRKPETDILPVNSLTGYKSSPAFGSATSLFGIKVCVFAFISKTIRWICILCQIFFWV